MTRYTRRLQAAAISQSSSTLPPTLVQEFDAATWGDPANVISADGVWRIAGDWPGTGGNMMLRSNGVIDTAGTGTLALTCQANSTNAGEIQSLPGFGHGYFECRMKVGKTAGTCQSFFLIGEGTYGPGEIDFEFLTGGSNGTWLNTSDGQVWCTMHPGSISEVITLGFNPCDDFHTYGILWRTDSITFVVDGIPKHTFTTIPAELAHGAKNMYVMANNWTSQSDVWGGGPPTSDATALYDRIRIWEGVTSVPV